MYSDIKASRRVSDVYINTYGRTYMTFILCLSSHDSDGLDKFCMFVEGESKNETFIMVQKFIKGHKICQFIFSSLNMILNDY